MQQLFLNEFTDKIIVDSFCPWNHIHTKTVKVENGVWLMLNNWQWVWKYLNGKSYRLLWNHLLIFRGFGQKKLGRVHGVLKNLRDFITFIEFLWVSFLKIFLWGSYYSLLWLHLCFITTSVMFSEIKFHWTTNLCIRNCSKTIPGTGWIQSVDFVMKQNNCESILEG